MEANSHASDRNNVMQNHQVAMIGIKAIYQHSLLIGLFNPLLNGEAIASVILMRLAGNKTAGFNPLLNGEAIASLRPLFLQ